MTDVEDLVEAVFDIEDIVEEVADPEELIEDFIANPLMILFAFVAAVSALFLFVLFLITLILLVLAFGPVKVVVLLMLLNFFVFVGSIVAFLYVRTSIPSDVYNKINTALEEADDSPKQGGQMTKKKLSRSSNTSTLWGTSTTTNLIRPSTRRLRATIPRQSSNDTQRLTVKKNIRGDSYESGLGHYDTDRTAG